MEKRVYTSPLSTFLNKINTLRYANCGTRTFIVLHSPAVNLLKRRTKCSAVTFWFEFLVGILVEHYGKVKPGKRLHSRCRGAREYGMTA